MITLPPPREVRRIDMAQSGSRTIPLAPSKDVNQLTPLVLALLTINHTVQSTLLNFFMPSSSKKNLMKLRENLIVSVIVMMGEIMVGMPIQLENTQQIPKDL